jgi:hypothetical protein
MSDQMWWLIPVIPATLEVERWEGSQFRDSKDKNVSTT